MGILNVTPDSFYDGGKYNSVDAAMIHAEKMVRDGADYIDIGGESTRPGSLPVCVSEQLDRVIPVIEKMAACIDIPISVDTTNHEVAEAALCAGATIINDISGLSFDAKMVGVAAQREAFLIIMHTAARPEIMQQVYSYNDVVEDVYSFLCDQAQKAIAAGVARDKIILDPGIGFGKGLADNYKLLSAIPRLKAAGFPLLIGLSRKSLIGKIYEDEQDRLPATIALNSASVIFGADIVRVHDVKEHVLAMRAVEMLMKAVS